MWDLAFKRNLFERNIERGGLLFAEKLYGLLLGQGLDRLWWKVDTTGVFSANSAFLALTSPSPRMKSSTANQIWNFRVPKKVKVFLLVVFLSRGPCSKKAPAKASPWALTPSICPMCLRDSESVDHFFIHCPVASTAWSHIASLLDASMCLLKKLDDFISEGLGGATLKGKA